MCTPFSQLLGNIEFDPIGSVRFLTICVVYLRNIRIWQFCFYNYICAKLSCKGHLFETKTEQLYKLLIFHTWMTTSTTDLSHTAKHFTISDLYYNTNSANIDNEHRSHGKQFYKSGYWIVHYKTNSHITSAVYFASSTRYRMNEIIYTLHTHNNCSLINIPDNKLCVLLLSWQQILLIILCILVNYQLMRQLCNNIDVFLIV